MANSQAVHKGNGWGSGFVEWREGDATLLSVVFSWQLTQALERYVELLALGEKVYIGGPAARYAGIEDEVELAVSPLSLHNPMATRTSKGCSRCCAFCVVSKTEGDLRELHHWVPRPIVIDNDLVACSPQHFDRAVDSLRTVRRIDIQGVSTSHLRQHHVDRFRELDIKYLHMAWDDVGQETVFRRAMALLAESKFPKSRLMVYVLIGFRDSPDDALYRLSEVNKLGVFPFPMRYQPPDTGKRNEFVEKGWTHKELVRFCRYWSNLRYLGHIPFNEFEYLPDKESEK